MVNGEAQDIAGALAALGIDRLVLAVHDASFPSLPEEDIGRGSPFSYGARAFLRFAAQLGFTGIQLGPQGKTSAVNQSPYDGTLFARSPLSIALAPLALERRWHSLLPSQAVAQATAQAGSGERVAHAEATRAHDKAMRAAFRALAQPHRGPLRAEIAAFARAQSWWLETDSAFEAMAQRHGTDDWQRWPVGPTGAAALGRRAARDDEAIAYNDFCQHLVHAQHAALREEAAGLRLSLAGDLQIGISHRDAWTARALFLPGYRLGAPPSRTNLAGQPWGYPVLDPRKYSDGHGDGPVLQFVRARVAKLLGELDGLRIDHPHGLVCPWVYRDDDPDSVRAVQNGARLFAAAGLPDHPTLAPFSITSPQQRTRDPQAHRWDENWVRDLTPPQIERYAVLIDAIVNAARAQGRDTRDLSCEVLSTCPAPLLAVLERHGLGRFRVTQKADPRNPDDPYRTGTAAAADWVMLGTHDTPPLWTLVDGWRGTDAGAAWAAYLAGRLATGADARARLERHLRGDPAALALAHTADLFLGPARRVSIFFADLLGMRQTYNRPGIVDPENWTLRVPRDFASLHAQRTATGEAIDLPAALALALRARGSGPPQLVARLESRARCRTFTQIADVLPQRSAPP